MRFSGIPNNGTLELVELSQEEIGKEEKVALVKRIPADCCLAGDGLSSAAFRSAPGGHLHPSHHTDAGFFLGKLLAIKIV